MCLCDYFEPCDLSTQLTSVISTDCDTAQCVEVVYKSAHNCNGSLVMLTRTFKSDVMEELDDHHDHENEIDKEFVEARGAK